MTHDLVDGFWQCSLFLRLGDPVGVAVAIAQRAIDRFEDLGLRRWTVNQLALPESSLPGSAATVGTLVTRVRPSPSASTKSVKVPAAPTPMRHAARGKAGGSGALGTVDTGDSRWL